MVGGRQINKNEDIVKEMQNWYQETANNMQEQTMSLNEFLQNNNVTNLPQITEEQKIELEKPFTSEEIILALKVANEKSASGPSGQSVSFFKLLFMEIPALTHYDRQPLFSSDFDKMCRAAYFRSKWNSPFFFFLA